MSGHQWRDHPESTAARRARARREADPPIVSGGQGRSAQEVADSAAWLCWLAVIAALVAVAWRVLA